MALEKPQSAKLQTTKTDETALAPRVLPEGVHYTWLFSQADTEGPWPFIHKKGQKKGKGYTESQLSTIIKELRKFETKPNHEMEGKSKSHDIEVSKLCKDAQDRLLEIKEEEELIEIEHLLSVRITQQARLWCLRKLTPNNESICEILWWDPKHQVYPLGTEK